MTILQRPFERTPLLCYIPLYWLVQRNPYNGLLDSTCNWVGFHPPYTANNHGQLVTARLNQLADSDLFFNSLGRSNIWGTTSSFHVRTWMNIDKKTQSVVGKWIRTTPHVYVYACIYECIFKKKIYMCAFIYVCLKKYVYIYIYFYMYVNDIVYVWLSYQAINNIFFVYTSDIIFIHIPPKSGKTIPLCPRFDPPVASIRRCQKHWAPEEEEVGWFQLPFKEGNISYQ